MKYRKKPVVIDAVQWTGDNMADMKRFMVVGKDFYKASKSVAPRGTLFIRTLEGGHHADIGDWIIRGVKGEFYPCKPDVFALTYEAVEGDK